MKILYIHIDSFDKNGSIKETSLINQFLDETELAKWFAYDYYNENMEYDKSYCRYSEALETQRLCRTDIMGQGNQLVYKYRDGELRLTGIPYQYRYRDTILYEPESKKIIDIRNFKPLIEKYAKTGGICTTEWVRSLRKKNYDKWLYKQGRKHSKSGHYKHITFGKDMLTHSDKRFKRYLYDDSLEEGYDICCSFPKTIRDERRMSVLGWWDDYYAPTENNWKEKKCRHQWQVHKPYTNYRSEEIRQYKECPVMTDEEVRLMNEEEIAFVEDVEFWEEGYDVRLEDYWREPVDDIFFDEVYGKVYGTFIEPYEL